MKFITVMFDTVDADFAHDVMGVLGIKEGGPEPQDVIEALRVEYPAQNREEGFDLLVDDFLIERFGEGVVEFVDTAGVVYI